MTWATWRCRKIHAPSSASLCQPQTNSSKIIVARDCTTSSTISQTKNRTTGSSFHPERGSTTCFCCNVVRDASTCVAPFAPQKATRTVLHLIDIFRADQRHMAANFYVFFVTLNQNHALPILWLAVGVPRATRRQLSLCTVHTET